MMLQSARCVLLPPTIADVEFITALHTDARVRAFLGGPMDTISATLKAEGVIGGSAHQHAWVVRQLADNRFCGIVTLAPYHGGQGTELAYLFDPVIWGSGVAGESVACVLNHTRTTLKASPILAETQERNAASRRLLERCGMHQVASLRRFGATQVLYSSGQ